MKRKLEDISNFEYGRTPPPLPEPSLPGSQSEDLSQIISGLEQYLDAAQERISALVPDQLTEAENRIGELRKHNELLGKMLERVINDRNQLAAELATKNAPTLPEPCKQYPPQRSSVCGSSSSPQTHAFDQPFDIRTASASNVTTFAGIKPPKF